MPSWPISDWVGGGTNSIHMDGNSSAGATAMTTMYTGAEKQYNVNQVIKSA